jgi:hypothetical protein
MPIFVTGNLPFSKTAAKVAIHHSFKNLSPFFFFPTVRSGRRGKKIISPASNTRPA